MTTGGMCMYYLRGACRFGNRCWNSHDLGSVSRSNSPYHAARAATTDEEDAYSDFLGRVLTPTLSPSSNTSRAQQRPQTEESEQAQKPQNSQTESPQPLWSLKNNVSGEIKDGTPDSVLVETVKKLNEAENQVKTLCQQLRKKNEGENFSWIEDQMGQCVDNDLQCSICYELLVKPTVLNCSHTFCLVCIETWTRMVNQCPTCRVNIRSKAYCLTLDTFIDKIAEFLSDEIKSRRETLKVERNNMRETNRNRRNQNPRRRNRNQSMRRTLGVLWGERDRDGAEWNISLEEALFDPIRLGDVLGRNRNDRDEWNAEFSDSSSLESNEYNFCSYCDNMGHGASDCPLMLWEENEFGLW